MQKKHEFSTFVRKLGFLMLKKVFVYAFCVSFACSMISCQGQSAGQAAVTGAVVGGVTGALIDSSNPWRGGLIGGVIGSIAGATIAEVSKQGGDEAARSGRPVEYTSEDGRMYRADPMYKTQGGHCYVVRERVWKDGKLVQEQLREICNYDRYDY
ncbi:MAG: hypothetical protein K940chlam8_01188 [Chlamydiae bacterium]|nr:hypothetical protein [Chlamydiota bacterium]